MTELIKEENRFFVVFMIFFLFVLSLYTVYTRIEIDTLNYKIHQKREETKKTLDENNLLKMIVLERTSNEFLRLYAQKHGLTLELNRVIQIKED